MEYIKFNQAKESYYYQVAHRSGMKWWIETRKVMHDNAALTFHKSSKKSYHRATSILLQTDKRTRLW